MKPSLGDEISEKHNAGGAVSGGGGTQSFVASSYHSCMSEYN